MTGDSTAACTSTSGRARLPSRRALVTALALFAAASARPATGAPPPGAIASPGAAASAAAAPAEDRLVVFAAASLRDAFTALAQDFKRARPALQVTFNFAGTQELRTQVENGAAADVFASADQRHMAALVAAGQVVRPVVFARNEPVIVVAREPIKDAKKPGAAPLVPVTGIADLARVDRIVIGAPEVPIGRYTLQILDLASRTLGADFRSRVEAHVVSRELNVRQVLAKVSLGEAQAGVVYRTDARASRDTVTVVTVPREMNVVAEYPIAALANAPHPGVAAAWVAFVLSSEGARILADAGFLPPAPATLPATAMKPAAAAKPAAATKSTP